jgi:uncharacterized protein (DUF2267 family)
MKEHSFLTLVKENGSYGSAGEASRAANAVLGTIKGWLSPKTADTVRRQLTGDASQFWQYAPAPFGANNVQLSLSEQSLRILHFILKVQQLGRYSSSAEARHAACSVVRALAAALPKEAGGTMLRGFPPEFFGVCPLSLAGAAA